MDAIQILWGLAPLLSGGLVGMAGVAMGLTDHKPARILVWLSPLPIMSMGMFWVITTSEAWTSRVSLSALIGAISVIIVIEMLRWIDIREEDKAQSETQDSEKKNVKTL